MSHVSRIEVPGIFHLVERRVRHDLRFPFEFHDRYLALATLHASLYKHGIQLCGYNIMSDRVLLVVIPRHPHDISLALMNADHNLVRRFNEIHHRVAPFWEGPYNACPFADEVAGQVLRYVDLATARTDSIGPFDPCALNSAAEHAGVLSRGLLSAHVERIPSPPGWRAFLTSPEDERFVAALELCLRTGKPFGPFVFVRRVEEACGRRVRSVCLRWAGLFDGRHEVPGDGLQPVG
ncbi:MAG TPA: hypothetical protein VMH22_02800 [bacterium]|nr:hypothetical protein [bacterium]